jgi:cytochrome bd-type quinol oxidase subunit 2
MSEETLDFIGKAFGYGIIIFPIVLFPIIWRSFKTSKVLKIVSWLILSLLAAIIFYFISIAIIFRNGMGPT